jgi:hypothetical protein
VGRDVRVPLFWYLLVSLGVPLVNGGLWHSEFWGHAAVVCAVASALGILKVIVTKLARTPARGPLQRRGRSL